MADITEPELLDSLAPALTSRLAQNFPQKNGEGVVPVGSGGTGANTAASARDALGVYSTAEVDQLVGTGGGGGGPVGDYVTQDDLDGYATSAQLSLLQSTVNALQAQVAALLSDPESGYNDPFDAASMSRPPWETRSGTAATIVNGEVVHPAAGGELLEVYNVTVGSADMRCAVDVTLNGASYREMGPVVRAPDSGVGGYRCYWRSDGAYEIERISGPKQSLAVLTGAGATGTRRIEARAHGSTIELWADGIRQLSVTDSVTTGQRGGIACYNATASAAQADNFFVDAYTAPAFSSPIAKTDEGDIRTRTSLRARQGNEYLFNGSAGSNNILDDVGFIMAFDSTPGFASLAGRSAPLKGKYINAAAIYDSARHGGSPSSADVPGLIRKDPNGNNLWIPFYDGGVFTQYFAKVAETAWTNIVAADATSHPTIFNAVWMDDLVLNWKVALARDTPNGQPIDYYEDPTLLADFLTFMQKFKASAPNTWICANLQPTRVYSYLFSGESNYSPLVEQIVAELDGVWIEYGMWYDPVVDKGNGYNLTVVHQLHRFVKKLQALQVHPVLCHVYGATAFTGAHPAGPIEQNIISSLIVDDGTNIVGDAERCDNPLYSLGFGKALATQVNANLQPTNTVTGTPAVNGSLQCTWRRDFEGGIVFDHRGPSGTTYTFALPAPMVDFRNQGGTPFSSISFNQYGQNAVLIPA